MKLKYSEPVAPALKILKAAMKDTLLGVHAGQNGTTAGIKYREVVATFKDGQTVTLRIKDTDDVYQVLINNKLASIKAQDDDKAALTEIAQKLADGRAAFQKKQAAIKVKLPDGIKTAAPTMLKQLQARNEQLDEQILSAKKTLGVV